MRYEGQMPDPPEDEVRGYLRDYFLDLGQGGVPRHDFEDDVRARFAIEDRDDAARMIDGWGRDGLIDVRREMGARSLEEQVYAGEALMPPDQGVDEDGSASAP